MAELKAIQDKFTQFLKDKGQMEDIDETLIKELLFNIELAEKCKEDIRTEGYRVNLTQNAKKKPYWAKSQAVITYQLCLKNITTVLNSLGLTVRERAKLKMALDDPDHFDSIMAM